MKNELIKHQTFELTLLHWDRYIKYICNKYGTNSTDEFNDLLQESKISLFNAFNSFDEHNGTTFKSYAITCIKNALFDYINKLSSTIRKPKQMVIEKKNINIISGNQLLSEGEYTTSLFDTISIDDEVESFDDVDMMRLDGIFRGLETLKPNQKYIVLNRLGINDSGKKMTLKEIGDVLGITKEGVRQHYETAIKKMRNDK